MAVCSPRIFVHFLYKEFHRLYSDACEQMVGYQVSIVQYNLIPSSGKQSPEHNEILGLIRTRIAQPFRSVDSAEFIREGMKQTTSHL